MRLLPSRSLRPSSASRQKLRAAVARRTARTPSIEEDEEPTTSFRTALIVVLLLHVVAGAGIVMFERISNRHPAMAAEAEAKTDAKTAAKAKKAAADAAASNSSAASVAAAAQGTSTAAATPAARPKPSAAPMAPVAATEPAKKPAAAAGTPAPAAEVKDSGTLYTVAKGDTLVSISKKQKVVYEDLLKLNKIDDPKKLRIGQKLHLPVKSRASAN